MYIKNRTYKQVRSHAQKFYLKLKTFKDEELGLDFTSSNVKSLEDIINIVKQKELISGNCGKLLHIISDRISFGKKPLKRELERLENISDRISFGKKPLKRELERLEKINEQNQINNFNDQSQINCNINNFYNFNQMNFQRLLIYTQILNEQIIKHMNFNNLSIDDAIFDNNIRNNFGNIFTNNNVQRNDLHIQKENFNV